MRTSRVICFAVSVIAAFAAACADAPTLPSATITSLTITGTPPVVGATAQYSASVVLASTGEVQNVTSLATWAVANTSTATVSKAGVVTGVAAGSTTLTVTYSGTTVSQQLTIP